MVNIEFDDLIYSLQKTGGISVYWREITSRISQMNDAAVTKSTYHKRLRGIPVISSADVFHSSHFRFSIFGKAANVTTAHDLIYEKGLIANGLGAKLNLRERKVSFFMADAIICISENTKRDLLQIYPALKGRCPVYVIYLGMNIHRPDVMSENTADKTGNPYLLYVGGRSGYKNFTGALEGYLLSGLWREGIKLICTGQKFSEDETKSFKNKGVERMVVCEEHVNSERLYELYRNAYCLLYTSSYEGFGLPPIEAMSAGCPVIASNISSIPEVVGDAGILIDPFQHEDISKAILMLKNDEIRDDLINRGMRRAKLFSWDNCAANHFKVYKEIAQL